MYTCWIWKQKFCKQGKMQIRGSIITNALFIDWILYIEYTEYSLFMDGLLQPLLEMHRDQFLLHLY